MFHCFVCLLSFGLGKVISCFYFFFELPASRHARGTKRWTSQDFHQESVDITLPETKSFLAPENRPKLHPKKEFSSGQVLHKEISVFSFSKSSQVPMQNKDSKTANCEVKLWFQSYKSLSKSQAKCEISSSPLFEYSRLQNACFLLKVNLPEGMWINHPRNVEGTFDMLWGHLESAGLKCWVGKSLNRTPFWYLQVMYKKNIMNIQTTNN